MDTRIFYFIFYIYCILLKVMKIFIPSPWNVVMLPNDF